MSLRIRDPVPAFEHLGARRARPRKRPGDQNGDHRVVADDRHEGIIVAAARVVGGDAAKDVCAQTLDNLKIKE